MKTIIFDFNRTLYNPDTEALVPGVRELLGELTAQGHELHLISRLEPGRAVTLKELGIADIFATTAFVTDKAAAISRILNEKTSDVYVVGDYLYDEIRAGNRAGAKTIWFRRGKFFDLAPETVHDHPWRTAEDMAGGRAALFED